MADWHLITGLLHFDVLETDEFGRADVHHKLTLDLVLNTLLRRALNKWIELFLSDNLIDFKSTHVANVDCYFHLGFYVTCSHDDAFNCDK